MSPGRLAAVIIGTLVLQVSLLSRFSFDGARPDVMILLAVMAGFLLGPDRGAVVGFAAGMAFDVVLTTPLGLSALIYTVVGYGVGSVTGGLVRQSWWLPSAVAAVGSGAGMLLYALVGAVLGQPTLEGPPVAAIVVYVAVINAAFAPLAVRALSWVRLHDGERRQPFFAR